MLKKGKKIGTTQCPKCSAEGRDNSKDNLNLFDDGHARCFNQSCELFIADFKDGVELSYTPPKQSHRFIPVTYKELPKRCIDLTTCIYYRYGIGKFNNELVHVAQFFENEELRTQKIRTANKKFSLIGNTDNLPLFGLESISPSNKIVITEGEIDAMSVYQATGIPAVSLPNGSANIKTPLELAADLFDNVDEIILLFDTDTPGKKASAEAVSHLPLGKAKIGNLYPHKDANDALTKGKPEDIQKAIDNAVIQYPNGFDIVKPSSDLLDKVMEQDVKGPTIFLPSLNSKLNGYPLDQLMLIFAETGKGKTTLVKELIYDLIVNHNKKIGGLFLEENEKGVYQSLIAMDNKIPYKELKYNTSLLTPEQYANSDAKFKNKLVYFCNFSEDTVASTLDKIRYLATIEKVDYIIYDNISFTMQGTGFSNERKAIDKIVQGLSHLANQTGVGILTIAQVTKADRTFMRPRDEHGFNVLLPSDIKGSGGPAQTAFVVLSLDECSEFVNRRRITVHKNRIGQETGPADIVQYNPVTGRMELTEYDV